jgi:group II intron reverse transcriptase/maturase
MRDSEKVLIELSKQAQDKNYQFERIYRIMCNEKMYIKAYSNIYANKGSATKGVDNETADGFNEDKVTRIIDTLKDESYQANPVKRTYIPKKNGKTRPLGIPNFDDRIVQEVCRMILEAIYEPVFSEHSHGFRPNLSCHTALKEVKQTFRGANWFIEGDIKGCFDNINHQILINTLRKRIKDERFLRLIWKFLKAGYLENWNYRNTYSGTPQGGIISPILANIYLNELDTYVIDRLRTEITENNKDSLIKHKEENPVYKNLSYKIGKLKKEIDSCTNEEKRQVLISESKEIRKQRNKEPYKLGLGNYKSIRYVRYADDFLIAVLGSKEDCQNIKERLTEYLKEILKLDLSVEKTLITHARERARFLNYEIFIRQNDRFFKRIDGVKIRAGNLGIALMMPHDTMIDYINNKDIVDNINAEHWRGKSRPILQSLSDLEIITTYNSEIYGLYNYYAMAENVSSRMDMIYHLMEYSCLKTLAGKHKSSVAKIKTKFRIGNDWGVRYDTKSEKNKIRFFYNQGFKMKEHSLDSDIDIIMNRMYAGRTELEKRISAKKCEMCGKENVSFHIHHVHKLKDLKGKNVWERLMIERNRKTLVLCIECHNSIHHS